MILFVDALTCGRRLMALEAMTSEDWRAKFSSSMLVGIRPNQWIVPDGLPLKHEHLERRGVRSVVALTMLSDLAATATAIVMHGRDRMDEAIKAERDVAGRGPEWVRPGVLMQCTARAAAALLKIPNAKGVGDDAFLLPTLDQCRQHFSIRERGCDAVAALHEILVKAQALEAA